jgi:hypothetical protein
MDAFTWEEPDCMDDPRGVRGPADWDAVTGAGGQRR